MFVGCEFHVFVGEVVVRLCGVKQLEVGVANNEIACPKCNLLLAKSHNF